MSDLHEPDLDRAFTALTSDLSTRSSAPGAVAAIATARRRRRRRVGAVTLVAAAAVAAVAVPQLVGGTDRSSVAGGRDLPAAALGVGSLTEATDGWIGGWEVLNASNADSLEGLDSNCLGEIGGPDAEPKRLGDQVFVSADGAALLAIFVDYDNAPAAAGAFATAASRGLQACGADVSDRTYGDAAVTQGSTDAGPGGDVDELWFARLGDRVALFAVVGAGSPAPVDATDALTDVLLRAIQEDSSFDVSSGGLTAVPDAGEGSSEASPQSFIDIRLGQIREATGAWSQDWSNTPSESLDNLPCVPGTWPESSSWAQGATIGDRGMLTYAGTDASAPEIDVLLGTLSACSNTQWSVHPAAGAQRTTAWASFEGGSLFLAERGDAVAMLQVRGLDTPTDEVATGLIGLLEEALADPGS